MENIACWQQFQEGLEQHIKKLYEELNIAISNEMDQVIESELHKPSANLTPEETSYHESYSKHIDDQINGLFGIKPSHPRFGDFKKLIINQIIKNRFEFSRVNYEQDKIEKQHLDKITRNIILPLFQGHYGSLSQSTPEAIRDFDLWADDARAEMNDGTIPPYYNIKNFWNELFKLAWACQFSSPPVRFSDGGLTFSMSKEDLNKDIHDLNSYCRLIYVHGEKTVMDGFAWSHLKRDTTNIKEGVKLCGLIYFPTLKYILEEGATCTHNVVKAPRVFMRDTFIPNLVQTASLNSNVSNGCTVSAATASADQKSEGQESSLGSIQQSAETIKGKKPPQEGEVEAISPIKGHADIPDQEFSPNQDKDATADDETPGQESSLDYIQQSAETIKGKKPPQEGEVEVISPINGHTYLPDQEFSPNQDKDATSDDETPGQESSLDYIQQSAETIKGKKPPQEGEAEVIRPINGHTDLPDQEFSPNQDKDATAASEIDINKTIKNFDLILCDILYNIYSNNEFKRAVQNLRNATRTFSENPNKDRYIIYKTQCEDIFAKHRVFSEESNNMDKLWIAINETLRSLLNILDICITKPFRLKSMAETHTPFAPSLFGRNHFFGSSARSALDAFSESLDNLDQLLSKSQRPNV